MNPAGPLKSRPRHLPCAILYALNHCHPSQFLTRQGLIGFVQTWRGSEGHGPGPAAAGQTYLLQDFHVNIDVDVLSESEVTVYRYVGEYGVETSTGH